MVRVFLAILLVLQMPKPGDVQKAIQSRYDAWSKAYMANDVDALLSILSPDYLLKTSDGTEIKHSEYEAMLRLRKASNKDTKKYSTKILKLKLSGDTAEVSARESMTSQERSGLVGQLQTIVHEHDYLDSWVLRDGSWLLRRTETVKERTRVKKAKPESNKVIYIIPSRIVHSRVKSTTYTCTTSREIRQ